MFLLSFGGKQAMPIQMERTVDTCADDCCAPPPLVLPAKPAMDRPALVRDALNLEWMTIGWMSVEAVVAIASGWIAGSLILTAFGLDSLIELASAGVLMWRLLVELRHGRKFSESAENSRARLAADCYSLWPPMSVPGRCGVCGRETAKSSLGRDSWSRLPRYRPCATSRTARSLLPISLAAEP